MSESPGNPMDRKSEGGYERKRPARPKSNKRRIPSPPIIKDKVEVERIRGGSSRPTTGSSRPDQIDTNVDVSEVAFSNVGGDTSAKLRKRLSQAAVAFENNRFSTALNLLRSIDKLAPATTEVIELRGLTHYRLGNWNAAIKDLEWFSDRTQSAEQLPTLADCHRAKRNWSRVEELWYQLGKASPGSELVEEGRIVYAGALADQGHMPEAIRTLETAPRAPKRPRVQHLRRWYALADLYERAGDNGKARRLFNELHALSPDFGDAKARANSLR